MVRFTDVTEQKRALDGLQLLAESGRVLSSSLDVDETLQAIATLAVPAAGGDGDGGHRLRTAPSAAWPPATWTSGCRALFERARQFPPRMGDRGPQAQVMPSGRSLLRARHRATTWIDALDRGVEHAELVRAAGARAR